MRRGSFIFIALLAAWLSGCASGAKAFCKTQAGNLNVRHGGPSGSQAMDYDPENRLTRFSQAGTTVVEYGYAADGTRLWKRVNQDPNQIQDWIGKIYEEKGGKVLFHVFAGDRQVCTFEAGSKLDGGSDTTKVGYYYHEDTLNTSSVLSDSSETAQEVDVYYPFGRVQTASPQAAFQVSRRFTGQVFDAESGLYYYNARYYDPELGRFIQPDTTIPDLSNPQSYNRYSYVLNDPLRYNDPSGHAPGDDDDDPTEHLALTLGGNQAVQRQSANIASAQLYNQSKVDFRNVASTAKAAVELNPVISGTEAVSGKDIVSGEKLTASQRLLAAGGAIPGMGLEVDAAKAGNAGFRAFKSFDAFKRVLGPAGEGKAWHHIVEQSQIGRFGPEAIHNTENVVAISKELNQKINAFYSSIDKGVTGSDSLTVRQWLSTKSYQEAREFGLKTLQAGGIP